MLGTAGHRAVEKTAPCAHVGVGPLDQAKTSVDDMFAREAVLALKLVRAANNTEWLYGLDDELAAAVVCRRHLVRHRVALDHCELAHGRMPEGTARRTGT